MKLTKEQKALAIEALLFASSVRVLGCSEEEFQIKVLELARKFRDSEEEDIDLTHVSWFNDEYEEEEPWADSIPSEFLIKEIDDIDE